MRRIGARASGSDRRGFALLAVLVAVALVSAALVATTAISANDVHLARVAADSRRALAAAELGANHTVASWDRARLLALSVGAASDDETVPAGDGAEAVVRLTRTADDAAWLVSEGRVLRGGRVVARRAVALALRLARVHLDDGAVLTARTVVDVLGAARIEGTDSRPDGWDPSLCPPDAAGVAGVAAPDTARICEGRFTGAACDPSDGGTIVGTPPRLEDPSAGDADRYAVFGAEPWSVVAERADVRNPPGVHRPAPSFSGAECDRADAGNWGDPSGATPCARWFPLVHVSGDLELADGSRAQGVLLVDGRLVMRGDALFAGVVVARDDIVMLDDARIAGRALAGDRDGVAGTRLGDASAIRYSSCAVELARRGAAPLVRARPRAWVEMF